MNNKLLAILLALFGLLSTGLSFTAIFVITHSNNNSNCPPYISLDKNYIYVYEHKEDSTYELIGAPISKYQVIHK